VQIAWGATVLHTTPASLSTCPPSYPCARDFASPILPRLLANQLRTFSGK
jgi:hypothetical protein